MCIRDRQKKGVHPCRLGDDGTHGKADEGAAVVDHENGARGFFQPVRSIIGGEKNGEGDPGGGGQPRDEVGDQESGSRRPKIAQEGGNPRQQYANGDKGLMMACLLYTSRAGDLQLRREMLWPDCFGGPWERRIWL